ncbi:uncharacterized protein LOC128549315 [Mercenaria mercenaria]|uniref:uncharacterized protein LOC128549315 n=1 Tax=Mercenaria mercenaria TaxID=6596 RepID=UPI00234EAB69|nr:uncharacterized protein LOC128549315 [Mercenaria mercenaria]
MDNGYSVLLHLHDKSKEAKAFAGALEAFICDYTFLRQEIDSNVRHLPLVVIVASSCSREVLQEIDQGITYQSHQGVVIIVYFRTHPSERIAKIENNFEVIKCVIGMDFKDGTLENFAGAKPENDTARKKIRSACEENRTRYPPIAREHRAQRTIEMGPSTEMEQGKTVLLYDPEERETSTAFTKALGKFITELRFLHFKDATEEEKNSYPIVVVVRSTTVRFDEDLKQTTTHLEGDTVPIK